MNEDNKVKKLDSFKPSAIQGELLSYRNPKDLEILLDQPKTKIAAIISAGLAMGKEEIILAGGRILQGALVGKMKQQLGQELQFLLDKGKIKPNYGDKKYAVDSFAELLNFIDNEAPDEDRFDAIKAMFFAVIKEKDGEEILNYQVFQITKKLTSSQLLTLRAAYKVYKKEDSTLAMTGEASGWLSTIARLAGHNSAGLVENDEVMLIDQKLISDRTYSDRSGIRSADRLTDLGIKLCKNIEEYHQIKTQNNLAL
ncbi:MAG: hypothetical protein HY918_01910 [Candidatus Doudnabacteria bacterium]|nr:hypothetical protein [Candidatus Doudnabacteria bacterium]